MNIRRHARTLAALHRSSKGNAAIEFALAAPVMLLVIMVITELGLLFLANAGLRSAVETGARYASIYPRPSDEAISTMITNHTFGLQQSNIGSPQLTHGTANNVSYVDITMNYSFPISLAFLPKYTLNLSYSRRAYQS